eukprot:2443794-Amphidinium_carterae.1
MQICFQVPTAPGGSRRRLSTPCTILKPPGVKSSRLKLKNTETRRMQHVAFCCISDDLWPIGHFAYYVVLVKLVAVYSLDHYKSPPNPCSSSHAPPVVFSPLPGPASEQAAAKIPAAASAN